MNTAEKDVTLFDKLVDDDTVKIEDMIYLTNTDTGKAIDTRMRDMRQWIAQNFNHDEDPLWPKHGNQFTGPLFEARHIDSDDFILVWRDVAFSYYKRFGRSTYISRALTDDETTQFFIELTGTLDALTKERPKEDPQAKYKAEPYVEPTDPKAVEKKQAADAAIAKLDAREGHYTLDERRTLLAERNKYTPNLTPILTVQKLNDLLEVLKDEGIPEKRPTTTETLPEQ